MCTIADLPQMEVYTVDPKSRLARYLSNPYPVELINKGQALKSHVKDAMDTLNRAYDALTRIMNDAKYEAVNALLDVTKPDNRSQAYWDMLNAAETPFDLHHVREAKHKAIFEKFGMWEIVSGLIDTRAALKEVEIVKQVPKEKSPEELIKEKVVKTFSQLNAEAKANFDWAVAVMEAMGNTNPEMMILPITNRAYYCQNQFGTHWVRIDWFLDHKKTKFMTIVAAAEKVKRDLEEKDEAE